MGSVVERQKSSGKLRDWGIYLHTAIFVEMEWGSTRFGLQVMNPVKQALRYRLCRRRAVRVPRC